VNRALARVVDFLEKRNGRAVELPSGRKFEIPLVKIEKGDSRAVIAKTKLEAYESFVERMKGLSEEGDQARVFREVEKHVKPKGDLTDAALSSAIKSSSDVADAVGGDGLLSRLAAKKHVQSPEQLALMEASGVVKSVKSGAEASAQRVVAASRAKEEIQNLAKSAVVNRGGRKLASLEPGLPLDEAGITKIASRELESKLKELSKPDREALSKAISAFEKGSEEDVVKAIDRVVRKSENADEFEAYRLTYLRAGELKRKNPALDPDKAWDDGYRMMLTDDLKLGKEEISSYLSVIKCFRR